ncbi:MAG: tetratricopeptide repeat protein, partial [Bacteroidales bacterium]|nr:tetratricopeptide repeat protein [Bacteroidales bacterium]
QFFKHEYLKARRTFERVIRDYKAPEKFEAMLWLGRAFTQLEYYDRAFTTLDRLKNKIQNTDEEVNDFTQQHLPLMYAELQMKQDNYEAAVPHLLDGISLIKDKQRKTRLMFILGQIYQEMERDDMAAKYFRKVSRRNPEYEMAFNAHIRLATSVDVESSESEEVIAELKKMLDDAKNKEYRDQIYYALGEVAQKKGNDSLAISHYRKSVAHSIDNDFQRATSSLKVADFYFDRKDYQLAQSYYDTAMQVLPADYPNYSEIQQKTNTLSRLVENLEIYHRQDSLQRLAQMDEAKRNEIIDSVIKAYKEEQRRIQEEKQRRQQAAARMQQSQNRRQQTQRGLGSAGGGWYFYNTQAKSMGYNEFINKWGRRNLEDLWRLSSKRQSSSFSSGSGESIAMVDTTKGEAQQSISTDPVKRETYTQYIPLTDKQMEISNQKMAEALYHMGFIYKIQLENKKEAIKAFEEFVNRFPDHEDAIKCYYQLYQLNKQLGNMEEQEKYKNIILNQYPDSDYALILQDPEYYKELLSDQKKMKTMYQEAYKAYKNDEHLTVKLISNDAINNYKQTELTPRFKYLRALSLRRLENSKDTLKTELQDIVKNYPNSNVYSMAQNILRKMQKDADTLSNQMKEQQKKQEQLTKAMEKFQETPKEDHFYIMLINSDSVDVSATKVKISDFNQKYFGNEGLKVSSVVFDDPKLMITVSDFNNKTEALSYFRTIVKNTYVFSDIKSKDFRHYVISASNYPKFYKSRKITDYHIFFEEKYLTDKENPKMGEL